MLKQTIGWGCALVALSGLVLGAQLVAQDKSDDNPFGGGYGMDMGKSGGEYGIASTPKAASKPPTAEQRINATLDGPLKSPLHFEEEGLDVVLDVISSEYEIPIVFDKAALDEVAISPDTELSINLKGISLRSALNLMFKEPGLEDLSYLITDEVLLITTEETRCEILRVRVYRVDDLLASETPRTGYANHYGDPDHLIDLLVANVVHDSWMENGTGDGEIQFFPPGMLIISQTPHVHDQIKELLNTIRQTRQDILGSGKSARVDRPITRGYAIKLDLGESAEQAQKRLATRIKSSVDWAPGEDTEQEVWIDVLPKRVFVRHFPKVVLQVERVLSDMQIMDAAGGGGGGRGNQGGGRPAGGGGFGGGGGGGGYF